MEKQTHIRESINLSTDTKSDQHKIIEITGRKSGDL